MSKYHGLPDIDTAPDVFETADEPEASLRQSQDGANDDDVPRAVSEGIDQSALPGRRGVEKAFGRTRRKDGSYQLGLPPLSRSSSSSSSEGPSSSRPRETPAARIRRLKAELEEVEKEVSASAIEKFAGEEEGSASGASTSKLPAKRKSVLPPRKGMDLVGELAGLRKRLEVLDQEDGGSKVEGTSSGGIEDRLRRLTVGKAADGGEAEESGDGVDEVNGHDAGGGASASDLDKRLASLEEMIGTSGEGLDQSPGTPLLPSLSKLDHLLSVLSHPRHLDLISRRLKLLLVDLDRAAASSRRTPSSHIQNAAAPPSSLALSAPEHAQLQTLFALLPRLDPLLPILPPLMARLRSLAGLHTQAGRVVEDLKKLEGEGARRGEEVKELKAVVQCVQEGVEESGRKALGNWAAVEKRMKDLEGRLARLNGES